MKMPKSPPAWSYAGVKDKHSKQMIQAGTEAVAEGRYFHWDKLRFRTPPQGLTHEQWWWGIKFCRFAQSEELPLLDVHGKAFGTSHVNPIPERLHHIDLSLGGSIAMPAPITNPELKDRYYMSSLVEEAITSSQLEGATTTRRVAAEMLRAGRSPRDRSERMILNNFLTMRRIGEIKHHKLSKELIFELHRLVTEDTLEDASGAGRFRRSDEKIVVADDYNQVFHEPPAADQLQARMEAMCAFGNGETPKRFFHPVLRAIALHFWLAYDHPFIDGNGRTARALFYWSMLHHGYWLFEFVSISQTILKGPTRYHRAFLYTETDDNDLTYFVLYHLEVIARATDALAEYIARKTSEEKQMRAELARIDELNERQRALITHAMRDATTRYTVEIHRASHGIVYETARSDLHDLEARGLLRRSKQGKKHVFTAVPDLYDRLKRT